MNELQKKSLKTGLMSLFGLCCGWLYFPSLDPFFAEIGPWSSGRAISLVMTAMFFYVQLRVLIDVATAVYDWLRPDDYVAGIVPDNKRMPDGRLARWPGVLYCFCILEMSLFLAYGLFVVWLGWRYVDARPNVWVDLIGTGAVVGGIYSAIDRMAPPPLFPLPYRWAGLRQYVPRDELVGALFPRIGRAAVRGGDRGPQ